MHSTNRRYRIWLFLLGTAVFMLGPEARSDHKTNAILIVEDELPSLVPLTKYLAEKGKLQIQTVDQAHLPRDWSPFKAVILYIHLKLEATTEKAAIDFTKKGGRLVVLHHSISSQKAKNQFYFDFLGIHLESPDKARQPAEPGGGYAWIEPVTFTLVNLNPSHYITSHDVVWGERVPYQSSDGPSVVGSFSSISLDSSEAYMNHKFIDGREKTVLCGIKFYDIRNGKMFMQDRALWIKKQGSGEVVYFMPGHKASDYTNANIAQIVLNAIEWKP